MDRQQRSVGTLEAQERVGVLREEGAEFEEFHGEAGVGGDCGET
jgi:hypothetical protein